MTKKCRKRGTLSGGSWIRKEKRLAIYLRDSFTCIYCGKDLSKAKPFDVTLDHIKCRSTEDKRNNSETNLITCCRACNSTRQQTSLAKFADVKTRAKVKKHRRRKIDKYLALAKDLISGRTHNDD